ncbi:cell division protein FtsW [Candidatus Daviesbacteria bacterium RIFCSPHIGHO2_01_FULL_44_29]|uniref:Probable peptidoglycan glycosyltransferase FtsW n=1 Tax=Candidatus Daviesbacteria bacterium RIFCSPHIGHO2_02_FULL_43_12 TaxID=1797776 RepID=A0A1F5KK71_9BACT|nr:MAG: cell division protein FtsW [Candidatus Daviesbacteria bacterium RIFCSPHIGHO2_01_FULL_44_29]OGE41274.1 MAG: cell division protein FtsW [Candidatus Daviesbacteria bacterium RIFCSPHIGHO2_02_FULL_43_12]OGE69475.1 MAG: cell division protein FtsW [Candidatus Daviesbacteria bacterium RIFCSPLOWO2_01_FULL_43_15]
MFRINPPRKQKTHPRVDVLLLATVALLSLFGLIMVYDSSVVQAFKDYGDKYFYIKQQLLWIILGFICLIFFSVFDITRIKKLSGLLFIISCILIIAVFIPGLGSTGGGAHRWLRLFGFTIQPTEIIKMTTVVFLAYFFEKKVDAKPFFIITLAVTFILGIFQKDLGSAIVYFLIALSMYFAAGGPMSHFLALVPLTIVGFISFVFTSAYRKQRILAFLDPFADPQGFSYHISQVLIALGSGGWFGLGLGQSRQKFEYIPEVTTDSIFAVIGEELGFMGALTLIALFGYLIYRGYKITENAPDRFSKLLAFGITSWLGLQTVINLAAMVSLIPLTGVPLPFISYGGSALLVNLSAIGILLNISKKTDKLKT